MTGGPGRVLSLLAHPDDAEFLCAGTLALLAQRGWHVVIATATPGDCGSATLPPSEIAAIRRAEAARAAALIGAEYCCLEGRDLALDYSTEFRRRFTEAIREARPDLVLTHPLVDYMADHEIVGRLVRDACFAAPMPNYGGTGETAPLSRIPHLYYCEPFEPDDTPGQAGTTSSAPATVIDISAVMDTKRSMLAEHASQREWLRKQHGVDEYLRLQDEFSRRNGSIAAGARDGAVYAERFHQHRGHAYPQSDLLSEVLEPACIDSEPPATGQPR